MLKLERPLIVYEMANNHQGSLEHGKTIVRELARASEGFDFDFAIKFQYRDLATFIHPDFQDRLDLKFVKRFSETRLSEDEFLALKRECEAHGFQTICTPFDEVSVGKVIEHGFDFIKVASCSIRDWPLLERIAEAPLPIIASTGGVTFADVDKVVSFFNHRNKQFALMHCVGIYPTEQRDQTMNRIDWFQRRYRDTVIGFSTHERPSDTLAVAVAVAKGARIFEKHVGVETETIKLNKYSARPDQVKRWLSTIRKSLALCGETDADDYQVNPRELEALSGLKRGAFAKKPLRAGEHFTAEDVFFAMPNSPRQLTAEGFSVHNIKIRAEHDFEAKAAIDSFVIDEIDVRAQIANIMHQVKSQLNQARIAVQENVDVELSHHYGVENFAETGVVMITCINREYAKKLIIQVPGQTQPEHAHEKKEETFQILWGSAYIKLNGVTRKYYPGDSVTVGRGDRHSFWTKDGVIIEEVSTTHHADDSYYTDPAISKNKQRKTQTNLKEDWWMKI